MVRGISDMESNKRRNSLLNKERIKKKKAYDALDDIEKQKIKISVMESRIKTVNEDFKKFKGLAIENKLKVMKEVLVIEEDILRDMENLLDAEKNNSRYGCMGCDYKSNEIKDFNKVKDDPYHFCDSCFKKYKLEAPEDDSN